nr:MAG TPA: Putative zinc-binding metallo-peptidase [Caudoviricetes sp.]
MADLRKKYTSPSIEIVYDRDESDEGEGKGNKFSLPYGLCASVGIDTTGMRPREAWEAYEQATGKTKKEAEKEHWDKEERKNEKEEDHEPKIENREGALEYIKNNLKMRPSSSLKAIPDEVLIPNIKRLGYLEDKFKAMQEQDIELSASKETNALAYCSVREATGTTDKLNLSTLYFSTVETLQDTQKQAVERGWTVPVSGDMLLTATITHEYGHILFEKLVRTPELNKKIEEMREAAIRSLDYKALLKFRKDRNKLIQNSRKNIVLEIKKIAQANNPKVNLMAEMSSYGNTSDTEWLAEAFANSQCGAPNEIGKATLKYLKGKGFKL